ncbi:serine-rich adhesin for platelets-like [Palaemon carinicauda]|uniref:serine-rich adhesin for platelets-like n=1 Tax=Palaemon carinicauda TaxID=392227 RepID=UPI0035B695EC
MLDCVRFHTQSKLVKTNVSTRIQRPLHTTTLYRRSVFIMDYIFQIMIILVYGWISSPISYVLSMEYDCTGQATGRCRSPLTCVKEFASHCPAEVSRCCPEPVRTHGTDELRTTPVPGCNNWKCLTYYNGWWANQCVSPSRKMFYCSAGNVYCCPSACRITTGCIEYGGYCISNRRKCPGKTYFKLCKGHSCYCCVPPRTTTTTSKITTTTTPITYTSTTTPVTSTTTTTSISSTTTPITSTSTTTPILSTTTTPISSTTTTTPISSTTTTTPISSTTTTTPISSTTTTTPISSTTTTTPISSTSTTTPILSTTTTPISSTSTTTPISSTTTTPISSTSTTTPISSTTTTTPISSTTTTTPISSTSTTTPITSSTTTTPIETTTATSTTTITSMKTTTTTKPLETTSTTTPVPTTTTPLGPCLGVATSATVCSATGNPGVNCMCPASCFEHGPTFSGVAIICPISNCPPVTVECQDGWTTLVFRDTTSNMLTDFGRSWQEYKQGFGSAPGEYWLGNEYLHAITTNAPHEMRIYGLHPDGSERQLFYGGFSVGSESTMYSLSVSNFDATSSTGADVFVSAPEPDWNLDGASFSTMDSDNDNLGGSCSAFANDAGWWFNSCSGLVPTDSNIPWHFWNLPVPNVESLQELRMEIKEIP